MSRKISEAKEIIASKIEAIKNSKPGLDAAISAFNKKYGKNSLYWFGSIAKDSIRGCPIGLYGIDHILGNNGILKGRIIELAALEGCGKTTLALQIVKAIQEAGGLVLYIDQEHTLDLMWALKIGVDIESLLFAQPSSGEEALDMAENLSSNGLVDAIIIDSVPSLIPKEVLEKEPGEFSVAAIARLLSPCVTRINNFITKTGTTVIFINQMRDQVGGYNPTGATRRYTPGGHALKFFSSYRLEIAKIGNEKDKEGNIVGIDVLVKSIKNKCASSFRESEFQIMFWDDQKAYGFWEADDIYKTALKLKMIPSSKRVKVFKTKDGEIVLGDGEMNAKLEIHHNNNTRAMMRSVINKTMGYDKASFFFNEALKGKLTTTVTNTMALEYNVDEAEAEIEDLNIEEEKDSSDRENQVKKALEMIAKISEKITDRIEDNRKDADAPAVTPEIPSFEMPSFDMPSIDTEIPSFDNKEKIDGL